MSLAGRDLVHIRDFSAGEMQGLFDLAEEMMATLPAGNDLLSGRLLATAFYEPSTRTRLSFEAAMLRCGGKVVGFADPMTSSVRKGETIADTARILAGYADAIVMRHAVEGAAKVAADYVDVPVINAGDGGHQHPTQTLTDLFTIRQLRGQIHGLHIGLCGDLKFGRTVHSLLTALCDYDVRITCIAPDSLQLPEQYLPADREVQITADLEAAIGDLDVLYMTRVQKERFENPADYEAVRGVYVLDSGTLRGAKEDLIILHPLPRVDEISYEVDTDHRAAYFGQAAYGVPVRMALLAVVLGAVETSHLPAAPPEAREIRSDVRCPNEKCANFREAYTRPEMEVVSREPVILRCAYCEHEMRLK